MLEKDKCNDLTISEIVNLVNGLPDSKKKEANKFTLTFNYLLKINEMIRIKCDSKYSKFKPFYMDV